MTIQTINLGQYANDGTGDDLRTAFQKVNGNFSYLNNNDATLVTNLGSGTGIFAQKTGPNLQFKSLVGGAGIALSHDGTTITIANTSKVEDDTMPKLGGDLDLNGHNIVGSGDIQCTVWGIDIRTIVSKGNDLDLGSFVQPSVLDLDQGAYVV
jgi:hypothetical protein